MNQPWDSARALLHLGSLQLDLGDPESALSTYGRALELCRAVGVPTGEAEGLLGIARAERMHGRLAAARIASEQALHIFESIRPKAVNHELRSSFFATIQQHFEFHIDLLMELHRQEQGEGYDAEALEISEQARARSLLDLLIEAGAEIRSGAAPELFERERIVQGQLNVLEKRRLRWFEGTRRNHERKAEIERSIRGQLKELKDVQDEIRRRHPQYAALEQGQALPADAIQREVLDEETLLLEYWLGATRGFLWAVTPDALHVFDIAEREEIEARARQVYRLLTRSNRREAAASTREALCDLSRQVVAPAAHLLAGKRLLIVADGALQFIPFAALPALDETGQCTRESLVVEHEIVNLPSASVLPILRRAHQSPVPTRSVAVMADPVFAATDERVPRPATVAGSAMASARSPTRASRPFERLSHSNREAEAILALVDPSTSFRAIGFDATKEAVMEGLLGGYRVIHFATHGILDTANPELSGVVLSLVDQNGHSQDGFLRAHEIFNLDLTSELVVPLRLLDRVGQRGSRGGFDRSHSWLHVCWSRPSDGQPLERQR